MVYTIMDEARWREADCKVWHETAATEIRILEKRWVVVGWSDDDTEGKFSSFTCRVSSCGPTDLTWHCVDPGHA